MAACGRLRPAGARRPFACRACGSRDIDDPRVLEAMRRVPRHEFVPPHLRDEAYSDYPLPIGHDQTISQPYIVAFMTQALQPRPG
jgi:protein-L-isoaspartate(D-aspartate) O-methyltransferase